MVSYKRVDETKRRVFYGGHPPSCTCVKCSRQRLLRQKRGRGIKWVLIAILVIAIIAVVAYVLFSEDVLW
jgi:hypothetical protein